uniref:O-methyltransferase dimerisation domain-containing protein n=1 Tax=Branchiostoma floridae TaxID=7739 RepID=C3Y281_BRAFL|eukprot:XP_002609961.1 hypothetical protein BRAFLDRAFT_85918 [Branchiostoma floridae]
MTAGEISEAIGTDADATKRLLNACTGQRLLEKVNVDQETELLPLLRRQILFSSVKLGIFNLLETSDSPMTAGEISEAIGTDADATKRLLNACTGQRLLEKVNVDQETGGGVLVADTILADDKTGPEVSNKYDLHMMLAAGSRERSGQELRRLLNKAGFTEVTINSNGYPFGHVLGRKPRI